MKQLLFLLTFTSFIAAALAQTEIDCDLVHTDPAESPYILPYPVGHTFTVTQSNCHPTGGHYLTFAYDFNTNIGDTILACREGTVIFTNDQYADNDWTSGHENNVFIEHADGTRIRYTHLMQGGALVNANQTVSQGQPIGLSGASGNTGGFPHLHLAAFNDGSSYNRQNTIPLNFCNAAGLVNSQNLLIGGQSYTALEKNTTSIDEQNKYKDLTIFPNPANKLLNLNWTDANISVNRIQLFSLQGKMVKDFKIASTITTIELPLTGLAKGLYIVLIENELKSFTKEILISF